MNPLTAIYCFVLGLLCIGCSPDGGFAQDVDAPQELTNSIGMKLMLIPNGTFLMGSPESEKGHYSNETQHEVTISKDYYLGVYEVTQAQYEKVMGSNPSVFQGDIMAELHPQTGCVVKDVDSSNHPVDQVSWDDAVEFCRKLSALPEEKAAGRVYRLPTEAEWEYACRAGGQTAFSFGDSVKSLEDYAWFKDNSGDKPHAVGEKKSNAWGLYDMHGNIWEWCSDWNTAYPQGAVTDPVGPKEGSYRVSRSGGWDYGAANCRSSYRSGLIPALRILDYGFRVALSPSVIPK